MLLVLATIACAVPAGAQSVPPPAQTGIAEEQLLRVRGGYLGVRSAGTHGMLTLYNDSIANGRTIDYRFIPQDVALESPGSTRALLLAWRDGGCGLYGIGLDSIPLATPIWNGTIPALKRIVGIADYDGDGAFEALMIGDSALAVVGVDGRERFSMRVPVMAAIVGSDDSTRIYVAWREPDAVRLAAVSPRTGTVSATFDLPPAESVLMNVTETMNGSVLTVATVGPAPAAYLFDPRLQNAPERIPLTGTPIGLASYRNGNGRVPAAVLGSYPRPGLQLLAPSEAERGLEYPLSDPPTSAVPIGERVVLLGRDSAAVYDGSFTLLGTIPSTGSAHATITMLDSARVLLQSPMGTRIAVLPAAGHAWAARWLPWTLLVAVVLSVLIVAVAITRRYLFVRAVYNSLVLAPGSYGIVITSTAQRVKHLNQSARTLLGIDAVAPLGRHITEYIAVVELDPLRGRLRGLFAEGVEFEERIDVTRAGEPRSVMFRGRPLIGRYGSTVGYMLLAEDVTQRLERERLVNWASVAHHIAHEMKTPLGTVRMTAEMLHDRLSADGDNAESARATHRIVRQTVRLREIVDDLLSVARTESLTRVSADMGLLVSSMVHDYADNLPANIAIRLELAGTDYHCRVDVPQLTVALRNLIDNAAQAIGSREEGFLRINLSENTKCITVVVEDNGVGMSRETLTKLFQPFYTERAGGSGIGTVIIKRVIEAHGGTINVESERGKGTRFVVTIPKGTEGAER